MKKYLLIGLVIILLITLYLIISPSKTVDAQVLASCLTEKGVIMYGSQYCPHCQEQIRRFGNSFDLITYHDCSIESDLCTEAGITAVPTWVLPDGNTVSGTQDLETLAKITDCPTQEVNP